MSICWVPKVHHTRFLEPSRRSTVSTGASAFRVRMTASWFLVGLPAAAKSHVEPVLARFYPRLCLR